MFSDATLADALSPKIFSLILLPTEKCNFRCTYCYEDFIVGKMQRPVIDGVKRLIARRVKDVRKFSISWFGGEPLLAKDVVREIGCFAHEVCEEHQVAFDAGFTTNGYLLTPELFKEMLGISHRSYQITLDGDEEWHDKTRILANRKPTFERIWSHLVAYKSIEGSFSVTLRLHVHRDNIESVKRLYERLQDHLLDDRRFSVYFHKVSNLNPNNRIAEEVLPSSAYLEAIQYIMGAKANKAEGPISEEHLDGYICYAAKPNSLMIRANGGIGKCTVALHDDRNSIGSLNEDGTLNIANAKLQRWMTGYADLSHQTLGCPLSTLSA